MVLATRIWEEKKGFLLYTQLQGVAKAYLESWLEDPAKKIRRTKRLQDGNKRNRVDVHREKMRRKMEESQMDAQIKRSSRRGQEEDGDEPSAGEATEDDSSFLSPEPREGAFTRRQRATPKQHAQPAAATAASPAAAAAAPPSGAGEPPILISPSREDELPRTPMRGGEPLRFAMSQGDASPASSDEEANEPLSGCGIIIYKLMKHYAPNSVNITMSIIQDVQSFKKRSYESLEEAFTRWDIITERAAQANVPLTESPEMISYKWLQQFHIPQEHLPQLLQQFGHKLPQNKEDFGRIQVSHHQPESPSQTWKFILTLARAWSTASRNPLC